LTLDALVKQSMPSLSFRYSLSPADVWGMDLEQFLHYLAHHAAVMEASRPQM
jgi:hypothetical protein